MLADIMPPNHYNSLRRHLTDEEIKVQQGRVTFSWSYSQVRSKTMIQTRQCKAKASLNNRHFTALTRA